MNQQTKMTQQFMSFFNQEMHETPQLPSEDCRRLRARLIMEEAIETVNALGFSIRLLHPPGEVKGLNVRFLTGDYKPNLKEIFDGLCDLHYVGYTGTALACGLQDIMDEGFAEVHRSNMSKSWTKEQVEEGKKQYSNAVVEHFGGNLYRFIVDGKVIKSPTYSPANLQRILDYKINEGLNFGTGQEELLNAVSVCEACGETGHNVEDCGYQNDHTV